ncbi:MAG: type II toxin-antitoxin system PemK/MazF family toxin [Acidobacteria bacterium]|nr:type II toxin-antitoxin system PemK/MazF family toxin [Acidobacteriota bacterium]MBI3654965.1 type II toxin-antitoxin system PemK/MazF family toxin [Acidobacteriota bacterium]
MKPKRGYVPERADVILITLDPQAGHERRGQRPVLVLSPAAYNGRVGLALLCPITSQVKGYPFEVALPGGLPVTGVVLADQVKSLDWKARQCVRLGAIPEQLVVQVLRRLNALLSERAEP